MIKRSRLHGSSVGKFTEAAFLGVLILSAPAKAAELVADATEWPFTAIGKLNVVTGPGSRRFCSATLVGRRHVLTAAHCLYDKAREKWVDPSGIHFVLGYSQGAYRGHSIARSYVKSDRYRNGNTLLDFANDWTIIELDQELKDVRGVPIRSTGSDDSPGAQLQNVIRAGYSRTTSQLMSVQKRCSASFKTLDGMPGGVLAHDCEGIPGESGSALLQSSEGEYKIIGMLVAATGKKGEMQSIAVPASTFLPMLTEVTKMVR